MSSYPLLNVFLSIMWFFLWMLWIFLVVWILMDIFANRDINGWAKAGWTVLVILLPIIGVLIYLAVHGASLNDRRAREVQVRDAEYRAGAPSSAFELSKLADLHNRGVITDAEFEQGKEKILR